MSLTVADFKERLTLKLSQSGLSETQFAKSVGLNLTTLRSILGKGGQRSGLQGPSLLSLYEMMRTVGLYEVWWLLTGEEEPPKTEEGVGPVSETLNRFRALCSENLTDDMVTAGYLEYKFRQIMADAIQAQSILQDGTEASITDEGNKTDDEDTDHDYIDDVEELPNQTFWERFNQITSDPQWQGWYRVELVRRFPELVEQIKKRGDLEDQAELERSQAVGE